MLPTLAQHLEQVARSRHVAVIGEKQAVRLSFPFGTIEMLLAPHQEPFLPGTEVYVWFKGGGFLCGPKLDIDDDERESRRALRRVKAARAALAASRAERAARLAADIDILLPDLDAAIPDTGHHEGDSDLAPLDTATGGLTETQVSSALHPAPHHAAANDSAPVPLDLGGLIQVETKKATGHA